MAKNSRHLVAYIPPDFNIEDYISSYIGLAIENCGVDDNNVDIKTTVKYFKQLQENGILDATEMVDNDYEYFEVIYATVMLLFKYLHCGYVHVEDREIHNIAVHEDIIKSIKGE